MNGKVIKLRAKGVEAEMDENVNSVPLATQYQVYRVENGNEVILGTVYVRKLIDSTHLNLNYLNETPFSVQLNDLIRSV